MNRTLCRGIRARAWHLVALAAVAAMPASCSYRGGELDNPIARSVTWFSYAGGDDVRAACGPGARDRIRLIYNGVWDGYLTDAPTQVRTYDIAAVLDGQGAVMLARVFGEYNMATITLNDPFSVTRPTKVETTLSPREYADLKRMLRESGFFDAAPYGLRLPSNRFWWLAAGCVDGSFRLNGWLYPSDRFTRVTFAAPLAVLDKTNISPTPPQDVERFPSMRSATGPFGGVPLREPSFILQLGADRLIN